MGVDPVANEGEPDWLDDLLRRALGPSGPGPSPAARQASFDGAMAMVERARTDPAVAAELDALGEAVGISVEAAEIVRDAAGDG